MEIMFESIAKSTPSDTHKSAIALSILFESIAKSTPSDTA